MKDRLEAFWFIDHRYGSYPVAVAAALTYHNKGGATNVSVILSSKSWETYCKYDAFGNHISTLVLHRSQEVNHK